MADIFRMACIVIIHIMLFMMTGTIVNKLICTKRCGAITIIVGFFSWYAFQELIYFPVLISEADILIFQIFQIVEIVMVVVVFFIFFRKKISKVFGNIVIEIKEAGVAGGIFLTIMFLLVFICIVCSKKYNSDFMHAISSMDMANESGRMYFYDSDTGQQAAELYVMEALGAWNMSWVLWCRIFNISAQKVIRYCSGLLCLIICTLINIRIGKNLFKGNARYAFIFAGALLGIMLFFITGKTPAVWLINYGGIPRAYCTNVVIPFTMYWIIHACKRKKNKADFRLILIVELGSLAVSVYSAIVTLIMVVIACIADTVVNTAGSKYLFRRRI